jgi:thymidylate synthase
VNQLPIIVERLREDPDTRQAVITLWDPEFDAHGGKKDHPCTSLFNFRIRDGKLNMSTFMRSNDAIHGWTFDLIQFSMLMQSIASSLQVGVGTYSHHVGSFHIYEPHWNIANAIIANIYGEGDVFEIPFFSINGTSWDAVKSRAFTTYRVVTQTLPYSEIITRDEDVIASMLLEKRAQQLAKVLNTIK